MCTELTLQLEDSKKRTVDLFGKLMQGQVSAGSCERLQTLAHVSFRSLSLRLRPNRFGVGAQHL